MGNGGGNDGKNGVSVNGNSGRRGGSNNGRGSGSRRINGHYGDYACDSPWSLIESAGRAMRPRINENIEFVLWTGDALSHSHTKLSEARRLVLLQNVTDLISRTFSSQFVFPVVGHDDPATFTQLADLWRRWLPPEAMQTFQKGGYYTIEQKERKLRIIILNTNLWIGKEPRTSSTTNGNGGGAVSVQGVQGGVVNSYNNNGGVVISASSSANYNSELDEDGRLQWEWLESVLAKSYQNRETVYLVGHVAPGSDERQMGALPLPHRGYTPKNNERYINMVRKYHKTIVGQFFGHLHSDTFRIIYSAQGNPISWIMMAPALTPRRMNGGANNPGLRLYKFDTDTGQVLDYVQYYLDLQKANQNFLEEVEDEWSGWIPEYNLTSFYNLKQITPATLHSIAQKFTSTAPEVNTVFSRYFVANSVSLYSSPADGNCELSCAHQHYCAVTRVDYDEYRKCIKAASGALSSAAIGTSRWWCNHILHYAIPVLIIGNFVR